MSAPNTQDVANFTAKQATCDGYTTGVTSAGQTVSLALNNCSTSTDGNPLALLNGAVVEVQTATNGVNHPVGTNTSSNGAHVLTPTFASGTAAQLSDTTRDYMLYLTVGTAGTATIATQTAISC